SQHAAQENPRPRHRTHPRIEVIVISASLRRRHQSAVICAILFPSFALAQTVPPPGAVSQQQISLTDAAALLIQANRIDEAERVLALALQQNPNDNEAIFLGGMIAVARQNYDVAVEDFRRIL